MKFIKTTFDLKINEGSSWKVYVCKDSETASAIHNMMMTAGIITKDAYWSVSTNKVYSDCRVPEFFHNQNYWITAIEHNNGSWKENQTYELYIVE